MTSTVRPRLSLRVLGETISAEAPVPAKTGRLDELLPMMLALDSAAIDVAVNKNSSGKPVSCAKGCAACCKAQPVPITPPEAYALWRIVQSLPAERRSVLEATFAEREAALEAAGLKNVFLRETTLGSAAEARQAVEAYVQLHLACPFLVDDACSIHPQRPFVCRQYLVTSSPALCEDPLHQPVEVVAMPLQPAHAMLTVTEKHLGLTTGTVPLVLALAYVRKHQAALEQLVPMKESLQAWMTALGSN
jgi:Fe-S-cluster containining protein